MFLDRDGVLNRANIVDGKPYPPAGLEDVKVLPGAVTTCHRLASSAYLLLGVTNQPDVARGTQSRQVVESINALLLSQLPIREILVCYHDDPDDCDCRKPRPGLILRAADKYGLDLSGSWLVGDRWKDIAAGQAAGLRTVLVDYHYQEEFAADPPDFSVPDVALVADIILEASV